MTDEQIALRPQTRWKLVKRDASGEVFEVVEGDDHTADVTFRRDGEPAESYAQIEEKS